MFAPNSLLRSPAIGLSEARRAVRWLVALSLGAHLSAVPLRAQDGAISGSVRAHPSGLGIAGASVKLPGSAYAAVTDSSGVFRISGVRAGSYDVEVTRSGITLARGSVRVTDGASVAIALTVAEAPQELVGVQVIGASSDDRSRYPGSVAIADARLITSMQPGSANEVLRSMLGVHVQEEEGMGLRANIGVRGLDPDRSRSLLVLEDGVPVTLNPYGEPEMYYSPPIERMERVELLKGSGSILFGPQTVGGVLNYVTASAPVTPSGYLRYQRGTGGSQLVKGGYGGTWNNARGSLHYFQKSTGNLSGLDMSVTDVTGKLGVRLGESDVGVKVSAYNEMSNATYLGLTDSLYRVNPYAVVAPNDRLRVSRYALTATHETRVGPLGILRTNAYSYETTRNWQRQDYVYNSTGSSIEFRNSTGNRNRTFRVAGIEPRLQLGWGSPGHELEAGVRAHYEWARDQHINGTTPSSRTGVIRDDEVRTGDALSAFVQNRFRVTDALAFTPGVRVEHFTFERHILRTRVRRTTGTGTTNNPEDVDLRSSDSVAEVVPGVGASWTPSPLLQLFAGVHRGFAPPRTKDALLYENPALAPDAQVPVPVSLQLDAERSWNHEVGVRLTPRPYLTVEATAFLLDFSNQIIEPSLSGGTPSQLAFANQGRTRHRGVESAVSFDLGMLTGGEYSLLLSAAGTLVNAEFAAERVMRNSAGEEVDVKGNRLPYSPEYTTQLSAAFLHTAGVGLRLEVVSVGSQFTDNFETVPGSANGRSGRIPAYSVMNAAGSVRLPFAQAVELTASVKNVADRKYISSRRPEGIRVGTPRLLSAGVKWNF